MYTLSNQSLKPLIDSSGGIHATVYLPHSSDIRALKRSLQESLEGIRDLLPFDYSKPQTDAFLSPIVKLLTDERLLMGFNANIGIFRKEDFFRVVALPVDVERTTIVADSFHVKPILKWMQNACSFTWVDLRFDGINLYVGDYSQVRPYAYSFNQPEFNSKYYHQAISMLVDAIEETVGSQSRSKNSIVYVTGESDVCKSLCDSLKKSRIKFKHLRYVSEDDSKERIVELIRRQMAKASTQRIACAIKDFRSAGESETAKSLSQIARNAAEGKIRKLIVADDLLVFGRLHSLSGSVKVNPFQVDHEDDDILDDIAQLVMASGGDVYVTKKQWIPENRPAYAILKRDPDPILMKETNVLTMRKAV